MCGGLYVEAEDEPVWPADAIYLTHPEFELLIYTLERRGLIVVPPMHWVN